MPDPTTNETPEGSTLLELQSTNLGGDFAHNAEALLTMAQDFMGAKRHEIPHPEDSTKTIPIFVGSGEHGEAELKGVLRFQEEHRTRPQFRRGTAKVQDVASFIEHVNRFADADSAVFANADPANPHLLAVLNYHERGAGKPRFGDHRTLYNFPLSEEWKAWTGQDGKKMNQDALALFIEDHIVDVLDPKDAGNGTSALLAKFGGVAVDAARMMAVSRSAKVHASAKVSTATNLATGETSVSYSEEHVHEDGNKVNFPNAFIVAIPVFQGGDVFQLPVRLRYQLATQTISWSFALYRTDLTFKTAFEDACKKVREGTKLPLFMGAPES